VKKLIIRSLVFSIPFAALIFLELAVFPIDFFTFRVWEALRIDSMKAFLPGVFYPRMHVAKTEEGDLGHHTTYAVRKKVEWETDSYGYRNSDGPNSWDTVIIGDSNTAGTGLTQEDMLSRVLARGTGKSVYALAPASVNTFLKERRFLDSRPSLVIVASIEWDIPSLRSMKRELASPPGYERMLINMRCAFKEGRFVQTLAVPLDRVLKANMLHFTRASLRRAVASIPRGGLQALPGNRPASMVRFVFGERANQDVPPEQLDRAVRVIVSYHEFFRKWGARFIFLPIPNKENIWYGMLPSQKKPVFLRQLIDRLKAEGVETIDTQRAFEDAARGRGTMLYHTDDSHWNRDGVRLAASLLAEQIRSGDPQR
jgi:alginate O-acetyltransferase complex protein AlgJ